MVTNVWRWVLRSILIKTSLIIGVIILCLVFIGVALVEKAPFQPGDILFPAQNLSEQTSFLWPDRVFKTSYSLNLLDRRIDDLFASIGTKHENITMVYLEKSLDRAITSLPNVPQDQRNNITEPLFSLVNRVEALMKLIKLDLFGDQDYYLSLLQKMQIFIQVAGSNYDLLSKSDQALSSIARN